MSLNVRILKIPGRNKWQRKDFLADAQAWMERHGWHLEHTSIEDGSAMFMLDEGARIPGFFHATRWLPTHGLWKPHRLLRYFWVRPQAALLPLVVLILLAVVGVIQFAPPEFVRQIVKEREALLGNRENWYSVNASSLNVRETPDGNSPAVGILYRNQRVLVERVENGWAQLGKPERGFVALKFLTKPAPTAKAKVDKETSPEKATQ